LEKESIPWIRKTSLTQWTDPVKRRGARGLSHPSHTMGELMKLYSLGTLVFVGGSLVPVGATIP